MHDLMRSPNSVAEKLIYLVPQTEGLSGLCGCLIVSWSGVIQSHPPRYSHQIKKEDLTRTSDKTRSLSLEIKRILSSLNKSNTHMEKGELKISRS